MKIAFAVITGMKPQSKLWKQIRKLAAGYYTLRFAGLFPIVFKLLDSSSNKFQCAALLKYETHYDLQISIHFVFEI
jgi:hypothetical protein